MGTEARVLEPESLKELVKAELHGVMSYYTEPVESHQEQPVRDNNEFLILFTLIWGGRLCLLIQTPYFLTINASLFTLKHLKKKEVFSI